MSYKWVKIGCTLNDKLMMIIIKYKMTGNERREKVLRSIFYPGPSLHSCLLEKKNDEQMKNFNKFYFFKVCLEENAISFKKFCNGGVWPLYFSISIIFCTMTFLFIACPFKVWHNNKKYKWQIDCTLYNCTYIFRSCKCSIHSVILIVTCTKKVSYIIYIPLSRKRKDMNNSSNLHVSAVSCLLYLPKSELAIASSKIISSISMQITFLRD